MHVAVTADHAARALFKCVVSEVGYTQNFLLKRRGSCTAVAQQWRGDSKMEAQQQ